VVTLTAVVKERGRAHGTPTGTITFSRVGNLLGTVALRRGQARLRISTLPVGWDQIQATYTETGEAWPSASATFLETVRYVPPRK
jgi:hypothetical protein